MSKSKERALEHYPVRMVGLGPDNAFEDDVNDVNRVIFEEGYTTAEEDLKLTWEDMKRIVNIADKMLDDDPNEHPEFIASEEAYYTEVLRQYNEKNG